MAEYLMKLIRGCYNLKSEHQGCVATIGNFDGVHRGHQQVISRLRSVAQELNVFSTVISFEPLPREFFAAEQSPPRLTCFREKFTALANLQVDQFFCMRFSQRLAYQDPQEFIQQVLIDGLDVKYLVVGDDFRFGKDRVGDFSMLKEVGKKHGFHVVDIKTVVSENMRISSTEIRKALTVGNMQQAAEFLGRGYTMAGRVAHGEKRGRKMGYPTANIAIHRKEPPVSGIFVTRMYGLTEGPVEGVSSLGIRPTFEGDGKAVLEVHLFDFNRMIYGENVEVVFLHKIRDEEKFDSIEKLIEKIHDDTDKARAWFVEEIRQ